MPNKHAIKSEKAPLRNFCITYYNFLLLISKNKLALATLPPSPEKYQQNNTILRINNNKTRKTENITPTRTTTKMR